MRFHWMTGPGISWAIKGTTSDAVMRKSLFMQVARLRSAIVYSRHMLRNCDPVRACMSGTIRHERLSVDGMHSLVRGRQMQRMLDWKHKIQGQNGRLHSGTPGHSQV